MTTTIERPLRAGDALPLNRALGVHVIHVADGRWRVVDAAGRAIGHIVRDAGADGARYRAQRFHAPTRVFRDVGTFWSPDDAVLALRHSR